MNLFIHLYNFVFICIVVNKLIVFKEHYGVNPNRRRSLLSSYAVAPTSGQWSLSASVHITTDMLCSILILLAPNNIMHNYNLINSWIAVKSAVVKNRINKMLLQPNIEFCHNWTDQTKLRTYACFRMYGQLLNVIFCT